MTNVLGSIAIATLTTAAVVHVWMYGSLFSSVRQWFAAYTANTNHPAVLRKLSFGPTCQYCFTHWVAAVVVIVVMPTWTMAALSFFPVVWLTNHSLLIHWLLSVVLPQYLNAKVSLQVKYSEMESQAQMRRAS